VTASATITVTAPPPLAGWNEVSRSPAATRYNARGSVSVVSLDNGTAWAVSPTEVDSRSMLFFDGTRWNAVTALPWMYPSAIGSFGNSAWVGGRNGVLAQLVQTLSGGWQWVSVTSPLTSEPRRIVGVSAGQAVAAGSSQVAVLSGGTWTLLPSSGLTTITDMDATSINNIVVVSNTAVGGTRIRRWDGTVWSVVPDPASTPYYAVLFAGDSIITANINNQSRIFDGAAWTALSVPGSRSGTTSEVVVGMTRCGGASYAVTYNGHRVYRRSGGSAWSAISTYGEAAAGSVYGTIHCGTNGVLRTGGDNVSIGRYTGSGWVWEHSAGPVQRVRVVRSDLAYMTYGFGAIARWDGLEWRTELSDAQNGVGNSVFAPDGAFTGLSVAPDGTVFVTGIGDQHSARMYTRSAGGSWSNVVLGTRVRDVWAASSAFALAVGSGGALRYNGASWQSVAMPTGFWAAIEGVSTAFALAVGQTTSSNAASARWDGTAWVSLTTPNVGALKRISVVSPTLAWAASNTGLLRWDGTQWNTVAVPTVVNDGLPIADIVVLGANDIYVLTRGSRVARFDGTAWSLLATISAAEGEEEGARVMHLIPGFGVIGTTWGGMFHSALSAAIRSISPPRR
jgi:hypothetical protein